ncbi:MAG: hypothetical protein ACREQ5_13110 [Candidatus Dormibacteria bacterium]
MAQRFEDGGYAPGLVVGTDDSVPVEEFHDVVEQAGGDAVAVIHGTDPSSGWRIGSADRGVSSIG